MSKGMDKIIKKLQGKKVGLEESLPPPAISTQASPPSGGGGEYQARRLEGKEVKGESDDKGAINNVEGGGLADDNQRFSGPQGKYQDVDGDEVKRNLWKEKIPKSKGFRGIVAKYRTLNEENFEEPAAEPAVERNGIPIEDEEDPHEDDNEEDEPHYSNFNDLVMYNTDGRPYIDVNKLIYTPQIRKKKENKEKASWYYADYVFLVCNLLNLVFTSHLLAIGTQAMLWDQSIESVSRTDPLNGNSNGTILRIKTSSTPSDEIGPGTAGTILTILALCNAMNVILGFVACISGYRMLLQSHGIADIIMFLFQLVISIVVFTTGRCDQLDMFGFQEGFEFMVRSYVEPRRSGPEGDEQYYATTLLDEVQISMQCCGASNWTDYLSSRVTYLENDYQSRRFIDPTKSQRLFPFSCCKAWWVRNIYCADNAHIWTYPNTSRLEVKKFRERIHEVGCGPKIWLSCKRLLFSLGQGLFVWTLFSGILVGLECFSIHLQIRSLNTAIREIKQEQGVKIKGRGFHDSSTEDSDLDEFFKKKEARASKDSKSYAMKAISELKSKLAAPTEDEIQYIKSRTPFAQFELRMKHTNLGRLLSHARKAMVPADHMTPPSHEEVEDHSAAGHWKWAKKATVSDCGSKHVCRTKSHSLYSEADDDIHQLQRRLTARKVLENENSFYFAVKKKLQLRRASLKLHEQQLTQAPISLQRRISIAVQGAGNQQKGIPPPPPSEVTDKPSVVGTGSGAVEKKQIKPIVKIIMAKGKVAPSAEEKLNSPENQAETPVLEVKTVDETKRQKKQPPTSVPKKEPASKAQTRKSISFARRSVGATEEKSLLSSNTETTITKTPQSQFDHVDRGQKSRKLKDILQHAHLPHEASTIAPPTVEPTPVPSQLGPTDAHSHYTHLIKPIEYVPHQRHETESESTQHPTRSQEHHHTNPHHQKIRPRHQKKRKASSVGIRMFSAPSSYTDADHVSGTRRSSTGPDSAGGGASSKSAHKKKKGGIHIGIHVPKAPKLPDKQAHHDGPWKGY